MCKKQRGDQAVRLIHKDLKMRIRRSLLALLFCIVSANPAYSAFITGPITNPTNGHSYYLLDAQSWTDSEADAVELGGHLAAVNDSLEQDWIADTFGAFGGVERSLWIGLNDAAVEGMFVWSNGDPVSYTNWAPTEPNGAYAAEDYVHMSTPSSTFYGPSRWVDRRSSDGSVIHGVVEVPEPATMGLLALGGLALMRRRWIA